jgi:hypothetical protein
MARFDEVFGPFGWQNSFHEGPQGGLICKLGAYDPNSEQWVWKEDGAENTQVEAVKGGLSSAMKRTAVQWGVGRYLYNLTDNWAKLQDTRPSPNSQGQQAGYHKGKYWATPELPVRWLPEKKSEWINYKGVISETVDGGLTNGMKRTLWNHVKAQFDNESMRKDVYQQAFDLFGQGDTMQIKVFQSACNWVTEKAKKEKKDPIAKKVKKASA